MSACTEHGTHWENQASTERGDFYNYAVLSCEFTFLRRSYSTFTVRFDSKSIVHYVILIETSDFSRIKFLLEKSFLDCNLRFKVRGIHGRTPHTHILTAVSRPKPEWALLCLKVRKFNYQGQHDLGLISEKNFMFFCWHCSRSFPDFKPIPFDFYSPSPLKRSSTSIIRLAIIIGLSNKDLSQSTFILCPWFSKFFWKVFEI